MMKVGRQKWQTSKWVIRLTGENKFKQSTVTCSQICTGETDIEYKYDSLD